jgi:ABC-type branched-subunit amino acid transport system ATPase component/pimeloyl-ACP methyl ester carboxylesterase
MSEGAPASRPTEALGPPVIEVRGVTKHFGAILAVDGVDLAVQRGQVLGIVGDNGAGKSTLVRLMAGLYPPDDGTVLLDGQPIVFDGPGDARRRGIEMVHQHLGLAPNLDATANFFLGRETRRFPRLGWLGPLDDRSMQRDTAQEMERLRIDLPAVRKRPVAFFSGGQRQAIAVGRSAYWASRVLIMDEPTAALGAAESRKVLEVVRSIRDDGVAVVIISHILPHVIQLSDHVAVMRHGRKVADVPGGSLSADDLIALIVGTEAGATVPPEDEARRPSSHTPLVDRAPLVVLIHSLASDSSIWVGVQGELRDRLDTVAVELPGHGSTAATDEPFDFSGATARVADAVRAYGTRSLVIVGLSIGGMVAQHYALEHADQVVGLMLIGSNFLETPEELRRLSAQRAERIAHEGTSAIAPELAARWLGPHLLVSAPATYRAYEDVISNTSAVTMVSGFEAIAESTYSGPWPPFRCPVRVVVSDGDPASTHRAAQELVRVQPGSQLDSVPNSGHLSPLEQPAVVAGFILDLASAARYRRTSAEGAS